MLEKDRLGDVFKAKAQIVKGSLTIWNIRLETLINLGDRDGVLDHMRTPGEIAETNVSCNVGCNDCSGGGGSGSW